MCGLILVAPLTNRRFDLENGRTSSRHDETKCLGIGAVEDCRTDSRRILDAGRLALRKVGNDQ
jgi:hypothetical protein